MTDKDTTELQSLFESVTGDTTVVEQQDDESSDRQVADASGSEPSDTIDHHGFADVIDDAEPPDDSL